MDFKGKLQGLLTKAEARTIEIDKAIEATEDAKALKDLQVERNKLVGEIAEYRAMIAAIPAEVPPAPPATPEVEQRSAGPVGTQQILATFGVGAGGQATTRAGEPIDPLGTLEYRAAFMEYAKTGQVLPGLKVGLVRPEFRADAMTGTTDVSAVIPSTILNELISKVVTYGQVFSRVRKLSVQAGLSIPILSLKPVATWIGQTPTSFKQKIQANTAVSFAYYGLECKVATSLLANTVTLSGFETTITDLCVEAMVKGLDAACVSGTGVGQLLGITLDPRVPAAQVVTLGSDDFLAWEGWKKKVFARMPMGYKAGAVFLMASGTWEGYIDGMVDSAGQPIGRVNYNVVAAEGGLRRFGGKEVIEVEDDIIAPYDDASVGDVVAIYVRLRDFIVNSNLQMTMFRYFDHDTNEWIDKAILIADGKLADPNGVVIIKKGA